MLEPFAPSEAETYDKLNAFKPSNGRLADSLALSVASSLTERRKATSRHTQNPHSSGKTEERIRWRPSLVPESVSKNCSRTKKLEAYMWNTRIAPSTMDKIHAEQLFLPPLDLLPDTFPILKDNSTLYRHEATLKLAGEKDSIREVYSDIYLEPKPDIDYTFVMNILNLLGSRYGRECWKRWEYLRDGRNRFHHIHAKLWRWHIKIDDARVFHDHLHCLRKQAAADLKEASSQMGEEDLAKRRRKVQEIEGQIKREQRELMKVLLPTLHREMKNRESVFEEYVQMKHAFLKEDGPNLRFLGEAIMRNQKQAVLTQEELQAIENAIPTFPGKPRLKPNIPSNPSQSCASERAEGSSAQSSKTPKPSIAAQPTHASRNAVSYDPSHTTTQKNQPTRTSDMLAAPSTWTPRIPPFQGNLQKVHATSASSTSTVSRPESRGRSEFASTENSHPDPSTAISRSASREPIAVLSDKGSINTHNTDVLVQSSCEPAAQVVQLRDLQKKQDSPIEAFDPRTRKARAEDMALTRRQRKAGGAMPPQAILRFPKTLAETRSAAVMATQGRPQAPMHSAFTELYTAASAAERSTQARPTAKMGAPNLPRTAVQAQAPGTIQGSSPSLPRPETRPVAQMFPLVNSSAVVSARPQAAAIPLPIPATAAMGSPRFASSDTQAGAMLSPSEKRTHTTISSPHLPNSKSEPYSNPASPPKKLRTQARVTSDTVKPNGTWPSSGNFGLDCMRRVNAQQLAEARQQQEQYKLEKDVPSGIPLINHSHRYDSPPRPRTNQQQWIMSGDLSPGAIEQNSASPLVNGMSSSCPQQPYPWFPAGAAVGAAGYSAGQSSMAIANIQGSPRSQQQFVSASAEFPQQRMLHDCTMASENRGDGVLNGVNTVTYSVIPTTHDTTHNDQYQGEENRISGFVEQAGVEIEGAPRDGAQIDGVDMRGKRVVVGEEDHSLRYA